LRQIQISSGLSGQQGRRLALPVYIIWQLAVLSNEIDAADDPSGQMTGAKPKSQLA
jgi:hypothetical protein